MNVFSYFTHHALGLAAGGEQLQGLAYRSGQISISCLRCQHICLTTQVEGLEYCYHEKFQDGGYDDHRVIEIDYRPLTSSLNLAASC